MAFCTKCGNPLGENDKFCALCGATAETTAEPVAAAEPVAVAVEPVVAQPAVPVVPVKTKVMGFVGMGLAIGGLFFAALGMLYTLIGLAEDPAMAFGMSFAFGLFSLPMSIVGRVLCGRSADAGNTSGVCSVGSKLGLVGLIVSAVMLFFGFICLFMAF